MSNKIDPQNSYVPFGEDYYIRKELLKYVDLEERQEDINRREEWLKQTKKSKNTDREFRKYTQPTRDL